MNKKNKISLNSTLIELIESTVNDMQEQTLYTNSQDFQYFDTDKSNVKAYNKCEKYRTRAEKIARKIVNEEWEKFTDADLTFYNKHKDSAVHCNWASSKTVDEYIHWIAGGEKGICDNPWHCILPVAAMGALFLSGPLGWWGAFGLSMGLEAIDAKMYWDEGDKETAGLFMGLALLPGVGKVVKKFPFLKQWVKGSPTYVKFVNGEAVSVLEFYQIQSLKANKIWIEKEVLSHLAEKAAKESIELAGQKVTKETLEAAMEKGYLEIAVDGITHKITKEMFEGLTQAGVKKLYLYTAKQQSKLIKFIDEAMPYIIAGWGYFEIYAAVAKTGLFGPKALIEKLWGIDPDDKSEIKIGKFLRKVADADAELEEHETNWDFIKAMFKSSGSATDGELMVQAIKDGWTPYEKGKMLVPKKWRTQAYKEWINDILTNEELLKYFMSDGSDVDNELLLQWVYSNLQYDTAFLVGKNLPEEYWTETMKEFLKKREEGSTEDEYKPPPTFD